MSGDSGKINRYPSDGFRGDTYRPQVGDVIHPFSYSCPGHDTVKINRQAVVTETRSAPSYGRSIKLKELTPDGIYDPDAPIVEAIIDSRGLHSKKGPVEVVDQIRLEFGRPATRVPSAYETPCRIEFSEEAAATLAADNGISIENARHALSDAGLKEMVELAANIRHCTVDEVLRQSPFRTYVVKTRLGYHVATGCVSWVWGLGDSNLRHYRELLEFKRRAATLKSPLSSELYEYIQGNRDIAMVSDEIVGEEMDETESPQAAASRIVYELFPDFSEKRARRVRKAIAGAIIDWGNLVAKVVAESPPVDTSQQAIRQSIR